MDEFNPDIEEEEEEEEKPEEGYTWKEKLMFAIDASQSMLEPASLSDEEFKDCTWLEVAVKVVKEVVRARVIQGGGDEAALIFFHTAKTRTSDDPEGQAFPGLYEFQKLDEPAAHYISTLRQLVDDLEEPEYFSSTIGSGASEAEGPALKSLFWYCTTVFGKQKKKDKVTNRILIFTRQDRPDVGGHIKNQIRNQLRALSEKRVELTVYPMGNPLLDAGAGFDVKPFWEEALKQLRPNDDDEEGGQVEFDMQEQLGRVLDMRSTVRMRAHRKRPLGTIYLRLGEELEIAVQLFSMLQSAQKSKVTWLHVGTGAPLASSTTMLDATTAHTLTPSQIRTFFPKRVNPYSNARFPKVYISRDEVDAIRSGPDRGLTLLGFKPRSCLRPYHNLRPPTFIYPHDKTVQGSATAFIALWSAMLELDAIAICSYVRTPGQEPRLVALLPQKEEFHDWGEQSSPPGLNIIVLPFADDIRHPEADLKFAGGEAVRASEEQVLTAEELVANLNISEDAFDFDTSNPQLQRHFEVVEALALDEEVPSIDDFKDETWPSDLTPRAVEAIQAFKAAVGSSEVADKKATKRKVPAADPASIEQLKALVASLDIPGKAAAGTLGRLTNDNLKAYLKLNGQPQTGNKQALVQRITNHLALLPG